MFSSAVSFKIKRQQQQQQNEVKIAFHIGITRLHVLTGLTKFEPDIYTMIFKVNHSVQFSKFGRKTFRTLDSATQNKTNELNAELNSSTKKTETIYYFGQISYARMI